MSAPKDPGKYKLWKENMSKAKKGTMTGKQNYMFGKIGSKNPLWKERIKKTCPICNIDFDVIPSEEWRECCSNKCAGKLKSERQRGKRNHFYGKQHSEETKDKLRQANSGERNYGWGKHLSQKHKNKLSAAHKGEKNYWYGRKNPTVAKRNRQQVGEKNGRWQGGISFEPYALEFNKQLKELIRSRDGYKCQKCGCSEIENAEKFSIHHIDYNKKNCLPINLLSLCRSCNAIVNANRKKWTRYFQRKVAIGCKQKQLCLARL